MRPLNIWECRDVEYGKDFDSWNVVKKKIDATRKAPTFKEKEVWWCNIGLNVGCLSNEVQVSGSFGINRALTFLECKISVYFVWVSPIRQ